MRIPLTLEVVLVSLAIGVCAFLGSLGWFAVGMGTMTDCTTFYSCDSSGCSPCGITERWINAGGILQWVLAAVSIVVLVRGVRQRRGSMLLVCGLVVLALSVLCFAGTTMRAHASYCRPGTPGYAASYCSAQD